MDIEQIKEKVQAQLSENRYSHTLRVTEVAIDLAKVYGASEEKVYYAALLHDYLKEMPIDELEQMIRHSSKTIDVLDYHHALWHGPAAAIYIQNEFHLRDPSIVQAIRYHTTGRPDMDRIEQIVFIADYIEPARSFAGIEDIRETAYTNIEEAIRMALGNTIMHLIKQGALVYPKTMEAYNAYTMKLIK